ncbi:MAG: DNA replication/repair protein RecF [Acidimicrobiia bacterium]|nr:DNA replication/repair protein RecF [Acidimicrobiia bacterium]
MHLAWLELRDFRSYESLDFRPDPGVNVLVGHNGAGKTNVLEAIGYLSALRSFRGSPDAALIRSGTPAGIVRGGFERESGEVRVEVEIPEGGRRRVLFNGKRPQRFSDVARELPLVAFLPDDLDLLKGGPGGRRQYIDDLIARLHPAAGADLAEYDKALRQRNSLLRNEGPAADALTIDVWDDRLADLGSRVFTHRLRLLDRIAPVLAASYRTVGGSEELTFTYTTQWMGAAGKGTSRDPGDHIDAIRDALSARRMRDLDQKTTTLGPHRDDPGIRIDDRDARTQASQGEQRSAALGLRIAAYRALENRHDRPPMLLLDDVFSELDPLRAGGVLELLPKGQVFVTTARDDEVPVAGRRWAVRGGVVT